MLQPSESYSPEIIERMAAVYKSAVKELGLEKAHSSDRDRLAVYILAICKSAKDGNQMLDRAVRMYQRDAPYIHYRLGLGDALANQFKSSSMTNDRDRHQTASNEPSDSVSKLSNPKGR